MKQKVFTKIIDTKLMEECRISTKGLGAVLPEIESTENFVERIQKFVDTVAFPEVQYNNNFNECIVIYED